MISDRPSRRASGTLSAAKTVSVLVAILASVAATTPAVADETPQAIACTTTVDVAALARALESRKPTGALVWEIGVRGSDCILAITDPSGVWLTGIRADRDPMLVAAEASWAWLHRERATMAAEAEAKAAATALAFRTTEAAANAVPAPVIEAPTAITSAAPTEPSGQRGRVGLGATALNGHTVSTLSAGYAVPLSMRWSAGADGWCSLAPVDSQFLYVDSSKDSSARPGVRVAAVGGFVASTTRWGDLDFGVRGGVAMMWAQASLASDLASVSETAWLPEASVHGRVGVRVGSAEPAIEVGYRAVVGDERVVGPSAWAFAGPTASLSLGWSVE